MGKIEIKQGDCLELSLDTTGISCQKFNRDFIGIEINENYFSIAKERLLLKNFDKKDNL